MQADRDRLVERCEKAIGPDRAIDYDIAHFITRTHFENHGKAPAYTASLDAAMTLVPETFANLDIFSFTRNGGNPAWGCRFHDTAQLMGKRAAKEEIARLQKTSPIGSMLRGVPSVVLEKAIAEHFIEFMCLGAATPALALCAAALRARASVGTRG